MTPAKDHVRIPEDNCPFCGYTFTAAATLEDDAAEPKPGGADVCMKCAAILFFDDALRVRKPKLGEVEAMFAGQPHIVCVRTEGFRKDPPDG